MSDRRQKSQPGLAFDATATGEARGGAPEGSESLTTTRGAERPASAERLMEEVCERENLKQALQRVRANKGSAGIDGMTVEQLPVYLETHWPEIRHYIAEGYDWVVDLDLEEFFDRVNHDILMGRVGKRVADKRVLTLIRAFLNAGVLEHGLVSPTDEGTPQGGPLSPLLSNLLLDDLDRELERRGHCFVRYADDCNIYVRSERAGQRVMEGVIAFLTRRLKLRVNQTKSAVARPATRKFLGFSFTSGSTPKRRIAPKAITRFKARVRILTRRTRGVSLPQMVTELAPNVMGWRSYFAFCETPSVLQDLDSWLHRRLRCVAWKQWKRGRRRFAALRRLGVGRDLAAQTAGSSHGPWHISRSPALSYALPGASFVSLGLPRLAARARA